MSTSRGPTVRQRRLGIELRRLRENRRLTGDDVAAHLSWSTAKVSRLENARTGARVEDVADLLKLYGVDGPRFDELIKLARSATERAWWEEYSGLTPGYAELISLESEADNILQWEDFVVPGLLQTQDYARHVVAGWDVVGPKPPAEIKRWIDVRMRRQQVLEGPEPLGMDVVIDESILRRRVGDARVMADQMEHLRKISMLPHVSLRILPMNGPHPVISMGFILLEFSPVHDISFPDIVHVEGLTLSYFADENTTHMYRLAHGGMAKCALDETATRRLLAAARDDWRHQG
ncbi:helix-turn-helix domain-containing protein [Spirillospora sp. NPDC050679]